MRLPDGQPKITLDEVCDVNEMIAVKAENEMKLIEKQEREMKKSTSRLRK